MNFMLMFLGACVLNVIDLIVDHDHDSKWQVSLTTIFINAAAALCYLTAALGKAPVLTSSFGGRPLLPMRYIQWSFTTVAMCYLHSRVWKWDALHTVQMMLLASLMSWTGLLGTWMAFPLNVMVSAASFYCFALLGQGFWHAYHVHLASKECEFSTEAMWRITVTTSVLWLVYPALWIVGTAGIISPEIEDALMGIMDVISKGIFTHGMIHLNLVSYERHRIKALLEMEEWGKHAVMGRLEAMLLEKDRVVASVCHELLTPVHGIIGLCDSLIMLQTQADSSLQRHQDGARGKEGEAGRWGDNASPRARGDGVTHGVGGLGWAEGRDSYSRQVIRSMKNSAERLIMLLKSALDSASMAHAPIALKCQRMYVGDSVRDVLALMRPLLPRDVSLSWDGSDDMFAVAVHADATRVSQILFNLMDLVRRFTRRGCIKLSCRAQEGFVLVSISHPGTVFTEEQLCGSEIFKPFRKGNEELAGMLGGSGFGLSVVHDLVTAHGGEITISCKDDITELTFSLPIDIGSPVEGCKQAAEAGEKGVDLYLSARGLNDTDHGRHLFAATSKLARAEEILGSFLPAHVTAMLLKTPVHVRSMAPNMAVLSLTIHEFSGWTTELNPLELVVFLDELFTVLDGTCEPFNALKVGWGAASFVLGLGNDDGPGNRCAMAVQLAELLLEKCAEMKAPKKIGQIRARIGIHCGPVCVAMIGFMGVQYALYGRTVEFARVLDASAYPKTAQLSRAMYESVQSSHGSRIVFYRMTNVLGNDNMSYLLETGAYEEALANLDKKDDVQRSERVGLQGSPQSPGVSQGSAVVARLLEDTKLKLGLDPKSDAKDIETVLDGYRDKMLGLYDQLHSAIRREEDLIAQKAWLEKQLEKHRPSIANASLEHTGSAQVAAPDGASPCPAGSCVPQSPECGANQSQSHRGRADLIVAEASDLVSELVARVSTQLPSLLSAQFSQLLHRWHQQHLRSAGSGHHHPPGGDVSSRPHHLTIPPHLMLSGEPFSRQGQPPNGQAYPPQPGWIRDGMHPGQGDLMMGRTAFPPSPGVAGTVIDAGIERRYSVSNIRFSVNTSPTSVTSPLAGSPIKRNNSLPGGKPYNRGAWGVLSGGPGGGIGINRISASVPASPSATFGRHIFPTSTQQQQQQPPQQQQQQQQQQLQAGMHVQGQPLLGGPTPGPLPKLLLPSKAHVHQPIAENGGVLKWNGANGGRPGSMASTLAKPPPMDVRTFLGQLGLESLCDVMERESITVDLFSYMDDADMADLGITSVATRNSVRRAARRVIAGHPVTGSPGGSMNEASLPVSPA